MKNCYWAVVLWLAASVAGRAETDYWFDNFETNATSHWTVNSPWSIGTPSSGPGSAYSPTHCGMTGGYSGASDARLICTSYLGASTLTVPAADQYPRLRFWHWFNLDNALGYVEISTNSGSGWIQISPTYTYQDNPTGGGVWSRPSLDLRPYAGKSIQIAFHFTCGGTGNGQGWYVDDVAVAIGTPIVNEQEGFESGQGDWSVDFGGWQVGKPANGPSAAHSGTNCAAVGLTADYANNLNTQFISPPFTVPSVASPTFSFWHWYDFNNALGYVEISTNGSTWTALTSDWEDTSSGGWQNVALDLTSYIGQTVQIAFHFQSGGTGTAPGWFIDDIGIPYILPVLGINVNGPNASPNKEYVGGFTVTRSDGMSQPVTVNLVVSGTATPGVDYTALPASVTLEANQTATNIYLSVINQNLSAAKTVVVSLVPNGAYFPGVTTNATVMLVPNSSATNSVASPVGRYWRGTGGDPTYWSTVIPLDSETGTVYSNLNGNCSTLYPGLAAWNSQTNYHYNASNSLPQSVITNRIPFNNPIVAFGEREGGTPLYIGQPYGFGFYAGDPSNQPVVIQAYNRSNYLLAGTINLYPPSASSAAWESFNTNGYQIMTNGFGLTTVLSGAPLLSWGEYPTGSYIYSQIGAYVLTHLASAQATNYYYVVSIAGRPAGGANPMAVNASGQMTPSLLYSLDFEPHPLWRSVFLDQPHFNGSPLPPYYAGKTLAEMLTNTPPVTNVVNFTPSAATNLDDSPELRRHPILDNFVASMGNDPIALANYVINQIGLTDPIDYNDTGSVSEDSINPGGVTRGALGTFLEKQGSPIEECALLVYLLRQAGVPAVYEYAPHNGVQILDARLSQMLKFQVYGDANAAGQLYTTNTMIPVNYPWVAAYIGTNWVHIFPWLKDYELNEGLNLWEEMPTNYDNAYEWVHDYIYGNSNLLSLAVDGDNTPRVIFPAYLKQTLLQNHPEVSLDDIGVEVISRPHYYARWQDFPTPTWVTNVSTSIESLSSSAITNVNPVLTNIFDTLSVEIYSLNDEANDLKTGDLRLCDLHNRQFYIYQSLSGGNVQLSLILMPFRTNTTPIMAFTNDSTLTNKQVLTMTFGPNDYQLGVRFKYHRNRAITPATALDPFITFLGLTGYNEVDIERPLLVGDQAAICLNYGQVTHDMLNVHAEDLWQMQSQLSANRSNTNSVSPDVYEGALMYLAGMSYYEKCGEFEQMNQQLQKFVQLSTFGAGLSKILPARNSAGNLSNGTDPVLPSVDMFEYETMLAGNGTIDPASGQNGTMAEWNFNVLDSADDSAEEHQVLNRFYQQTNAVSTVRLLQLAQSGGAGIVELDGYNYVTKGQTSYQSKQLQSWDTSMWQQVTNALGLGFVTAYMTPGPMTNAYYSGMGVAILNPFDYSWLITPYSINGGMAGQQFPPNTVSAVNSPNYSVSDNDGDYGVAVTAPTADSQVLSDETASFAVPTVDTQTAAGDYVISPTDSAIAINEAQVLGLPVGGTLADVAGAGETAAQGGTMSGSSDPSQFGALVAEPVNDITGEFYVNETDLALPGPIPLALRRNYSSENLADNQFGYGWKLSIMPYLALSQGSTNIYAADMDGAVLAYVHSASNTNLWSPTLAANPQLNNNTTAGVGGLANRLRDYLLRSFNGSSTNYTLYGADGSVRVFQFMKFNSGTITNARPYLTQWTDNRGNFYTFSYDTNAADSNFGQMQKVQCSNGNYLCFDYDIYGHMIDAYSGDGRWVYYDFDEYGDLVTVTLPDSTTRSYQYQHGTQAVTGGNATYSTHLLIEEDQPEGRSIINTFDSQRRVTNQWSTAGSDLNPVRTATFIYSNNFALTNPYTSTVSGSTWVIDGNNHTNRYDYTNNLITKITDPLGLTIQQTWYPDTAAAPGYPRSLSQTIDKRGKITQFLFDGNGNVTNTITFGDLTGDGITTQTATNTAIYNSNSLPLQLTDPANNSVVMVYDPVFTFLPQQTIRCAGAIPVSTNYTLYGNAATVVTNGSLIQTNLAFGLPVCQIRACGSSDASTNALFYNGNGFLTQSMRYTGTGDPNVPTTFFYNERGQMVNRVDALGAVTLFDYDAMNRPIEQENFDEFGNALSWNFNYYTDNGELAWTEGPRYNPENYEYYDYDGAGRCTTHIHWRSEANSAGAGVEAPAGYNLCAQTFYQYDPLGNLLLQVDPRGAMTTNVWDPLCRLAQRTHLDTNGVTVLSTESFGYEPGGRVRNYTNALGGVTTTLYNITGQPEFRANPDGSTNAWRYYLDGRICKQVQGNGAYWLTTYDDVDRITTRTFYSAAGVPEATNSLQLDRRGNPIQRVDAGGNVFTTTFDGLDRVKVAAGPAIVTVNGQPSGNPPTGPTIYTTNTLQQMVTSYYDAAGRVLTNVDALGNTAVTTMDALGRTTATLVYSSSGTLVREKYFAYSADHNSVTVTDGSGPTAVSHTTWTDTDGHTVLSVAYPAGGASEFTLNQYDLAGNLISAQHDSSAGGPVTTWTTVSLAYDGLNRVTQKVDRDNALTSYGYDPLNDLTSRVMPGGNLAYAASFSPDGRMLAEWNTSGSSTTRSNNYTYFGAGSPFVGLLQTKTDGRGVTCAYTYDDWLRPTNFAYGGSLPEQAVTTTLQYEPRGYLDTITEQFASTNTGPATTINRSYDPYGQLATESAAGGSFAYSDSQTFDAAGRRTQLSLLYPPSSILYGFDWQADGSLIGASDATGNGVYTYDTAGILTSRQAGNRLTSIVSRDGEGRPLYLSTLVNLAAQLTETNVWSGDGLLLSETLSRGDFGADARAYGYAGLSRRLIQEQLNVSAATTWTNSFAYDNGTASGPGVLTSAGQLGQGSALWSGLAGSFSRVSASTNTLISLSAYGHTLGLVTLSAWLDDQPVPVTGIDDGANAMEWRAPLQLTPGSHQLAVCAQELNGLYTIWATNTFTNTAAYQAATDTYDNAGNITNRVWLNPSGGVDRIQTLSWDARGRLHAVTERDANTNGYNWTATYDGLNRRLSTTSVLVTNGIAFTASPTVINSYYDPQVEFLELGVNYGATTEWKLYGPDLSGVYGGMNGVGGLDAVSPLLNLFYPTLSDERGNVLGVVANSAVSWNPSRPTGYGSVPNYQPLPLANGADLSLASAWRGRWADITGFYSIGLRPYDPASGRWLTFDSVWNETDPNGLSFCGGDPIDHFDSDGRCIESGASAVGNFYYNGGPAGYVLNGIGSALNSYSGNNAYLGGYTAYLGTLYNEAGAMVSPSTYVNGLSSFGNNINTVYNDSGLLPAISYGTTSWNVGAVWSGAANINLATGQPVGNGVDQAEDILSGIAGTAGVAAGGVSLFNWATAPAATTPAAATPVVPTGDAPPASITTPYAVETQGSSAEAQAALTQAQSGATVYRTGQLGVSMTGESQYWSLQNPLLNPNYAAEMGMPGVTPDFIMTGTLNPGASVIANEAPGLGANLGGKIQIVTQPGGVGNLGFHMP